MLPKRSCGRRNFVSISEQGAAARRVQGSSVPDVPGAPGIPGDPETLFPPGRKFAWQKRFPDDCYEHVKVSLGLLPTPQTKHAAAWILNLIEAIHWASFPIGFYVTGYIYNHATAIAASAPGGVYYIMLGLLCQVFGGGISGNMMHVYEGWQVTPFVNPIGLPASSSDPQAPPPPPDREWTDAIRVTHFNNAWLRATAYQMLFSFQALGLGLFSLAVFGVSAWTVLLTVGSALIAILGPKTPRTNFYRTVDGQPRPYLPLSVSLLAVFAVNVVINLFANYVLFHECVRAFIAAGFKGVIGSAPGPLVSLFAILGSVAGPLLIAAGGAIEGYFAETSFNQWHHFIAFVILTAGLVVELGMYVLLVGAA